MSLEAQVRVINEAVIYPSIPVTKEGIGVLVFVLDTEKRNVIPTFGPYSSVLEPRLKRAKRLVLAANIARGRPIYNIIDYNALLSWEPVVNPNEVIDLEPLEASINNVITENRLSDPYLILAIRGALLQASLVHLAKIQGIDAYSRIDAPIVVKIDGFYAADPLIVGLVKNVKVYPGEVPVAVGEKIVDLNRDELAYLATIKAGSIPIAYRIANKMVETVVTVLEERLRSRIESELTLDRLLKAIGKGLEAVAKNVMSSAPGDSKETKSNVKLQEADLERVAKEIDEALSALDKGG